MERLPATPPHMARVGEDPIYSRLNLHNPEGHPVVIRNVARRRPDQTDPGEGYLEASSVSELPDMTTNPNVEELNDATPDGRSAELVKDESVLVVEAETDDASVDPDVETTDIELTDEELEKLGIQRDTARRYPTLVEELRALRAEQLLVEESAAASTDVVGDTPTSATGELMLVGEPVVDEADNDDEREVPAELVAAPAAVTPVAVAMSGVSRSRRSRWERWYLTDGGDLRFFRTAVTALAAVAVVGAIAGAVEHGLHWLSVQGMIHGDASTTPSHNSLPNAPAAQQPEVSSGTAAVQNDANRMEHVSLGHQYTGETDPSTYNLAYGTDDWQVANYAHQHGITLSDDPNAAPGTVDPMSSAFRTAVNNFEANNGIVDPTQVDQSTVRTINEPTLRWDFPQLARRLLQMKQG